MIIGIFVLYSHLLPFYELYIRTCRYILSRHPRPVKTYQKEEVEQMQKLWTPEDQRLLGSLNKYIVSRYMLAIPDSSQRFYIKAYWSTDGMVVVLIKSYE